MLAKRLLILLVALAATALLVPLSAPANSPAGSVTAAKKKKCKKGYRAVRVRRNGHRVWVCRRKSAPAGPAGPSVQEAEAMIVAQEQSNHQAWLGPESIEVVFDQPTQIGQRVKYDPYGADPNHAGGPIDAWPARMYFHSIDHHHTNPADDQVHYGGCEGHLDHAWPHDSLVMFFRDTNGAWTFRSTPATQFGGCG